MGVDTQESNGQNALNDLHSHLIECWKRSLPNFRKNRHSVGRMRECRVQRDDYSDFPCPISPVAVITNTPALRSRLTFDRSELKIPHTMTDRLHILSHTQSELTSEFYLDSSMPCLTNS